MEAMQLMMWLTVKRLKFYFPTGLLSCSLHYQILRLPAEYAVPIFPYAFIPAVSVCLFPFLKIQQQPVS